MDETNTAGGIDDARVTAWFEANVREARPPFVYEAVAGGHSNLTFIVTDSEGSRFVLRRPPLGHVLATAHDVGREHRIISALAGTPVPVPPALGYCDDVEVNGAPFYVMRFVEGHVLRDADIAEKVLDLDGRRRAGESIVDVLAAIHAVDPDAVGLGELGRREGYVERQMKRWYRQWESSKTRELPAIDDVYHQLVARVPEQGAATIVHGDYRLDNCMVGDDGSVVAVLDWEICTLGDPLADVGLLMVYWTEMGDERSALLTAPTALPGFPTRAELLERYAQRSGRDLSGIDFYVAFGSWKVACILEGVYARYLHGATGKRHEGFEGFKDNVEHLAAAAAEAAGRLS